MAGEDDPGGAMTAAEEEAALERALQETPKGAVAVAGVSVGLLLVCWLAIYFLIFLPRGSVG